VPSTIESPGWQTQGRVCRGGVAAGQSSITREIRASSCSPLSCTLTADGRGVSGVADEAGALVSGNEEVVGPGEGMSPGVSMHSWVLRVEGDMLSRSRLML
jgi:hypothetical protein